MKPPKNFVAAHCKLTFFLDLTGTGTLSVLYGSARQDDEPTTVFVNMMDVVSEKDSFFPAIELAPNAQARCIGFEFY